MLDKMETGSSAKSLRIIHEESEAPCCFWLGLFRRGGLGVREIWHLDSVLDFMQEVDENGLDEDRSLVLSQVRGEEANFIYLQPVPEVEQREWLVSLTETVQAWSPQAVGFYLTPTLQTANNLLFAALQELMLSSSACEYYVLSCGQNLNQMLSTALKLKLSLVSKDVKLWILH